MKTPSKNLQKIKELEKGWKQTQADFENYRKRAEAQTFELVQMSNADFMTKITPVLDNFRRAFAFRHAHAPENDKWISGVKQIEKQLEDILISEGLEKITAGPKTKFDPAIHEAISCEENDKIPTDHIIAEVESGWIFNNKVLKPAKVRVSKGKKS